MQTLKNLPKAEDNLRDFFALAEKSFEFWNNKKDDTYQVFIDKDSGTFRERLLNNNL